MKIRKAKNKKILFVCKHNVFRSQVAEQFFKKLNKNKNYTADSVGLIKWKKENLIDDKNYYIEKNLAKKLFNIKIGKNSKGFSYSLLKQTDIIVIVADDVPPSIFKNEKAFKGKTIVWRIIDVKSNDKNKEKIIYNSIKKIENKVKSLIKELK